jgi:guanosine-3',5'-bis(diphosphate) 3'-pyrophosphohydrolase
LKAIIFAAEKHQGQSRKDAEATPYIIHPIGVALILWEEGKVTSVNVLAAAILHDTLEDTETSADELDAHFNRRIRETVEEVTNDPHLDAEQNKHRQIDHAQMMTLNAQLVKLADRLYNIRDLRNPPPAWSKEKILGYLTWGEKLRQALRGTNSAIEKALQREVEELRLRHQG